MTTKDRIKAAALAFIVLFILFSIDALSHTKGQYVLGTLGWVALATLYHCIALDAVVNRSRIGMSLLWVGAILASSSAFYFLDNYAVATIVAIGLCGYTWLLLLFLKKEFDEESSAV